MCPHMYCICWNSDSSFAKLTIVNIFRYTALIIMLVSMHLHWCLIYPMHLVFEDIEVVKWTPFGIGQLLQLNKQCLHIELVDKLITLSVGEGGR